MMYLWNTTSKMAADFEGTDIQNLFRIIEENSLILFFPLVLKVLVFKFKTGSKLHYLKDEKKAVFVGKKQPNRKNIKNKVLPAYPKQGTRSSHSI